MAKNQNLKDVVASLELEKLAKASLEVGNFEDTKYKQPIVITIK
jgi:hypothetical protein